MALEVFARVLADAQVPAIDDREPEAAGRHGVLGGRAVLVKRDLDARYTRPPPYRIHEFAGRMAITSLAAEQDHAVAVAPVAVVEAPFAAMIEPHQRIDPAGAVKIRPLIAQAQVHLDDGSADRFEIQHSGVAGQMTADPRAAYLLDV